MTASKNLSMLNSSDPMKSCHILAKFEKKEILSSVSYEPVILARKVPHALSTDKNVSKLVSSLSDAHAKGGIAHVRQNNMSINTATVLFFFKIYPLLNIQISKTQRGSFCPRPAGLQRASPVILLRVFILPSQTLQGFWACLCHSRAVLLCSKQRAGAARLQ